MFTLSKFNFNKSALLFFEKSNCVNTHKEKKIYKFCMLPSQTYKNRTTYQKNLT